MTGKKARARKKKSERRDANAGNAAIAGEAIPGLPDHLVATQILRSEYFDDPADLARLPAVSRTMRDAVAETGIRFEDHDEEDAVELGCLTAVERLQRGGRLSSQEYVCYAAARSGQLEKLKEFRADGCPWNEWTCSSAAYGGHLEVLQWLRANCCPWDEDTCKFAAQGGHLEVLQWLCANGCPWDTNTCRGAAEGGHLDVLLWARENGCPRDETELSIITARYGHEPVVRALIEAGADVNKARDTGETPLFIAAQFGHEAVVRVPIELGANIHTLEKSGGTPLFFAALFGHETVVRLMIEAGAVINKAINGGATPLYVSAQNGHTARLFSFSGMPARCDDGNVGVYCPHVGRMQRTRRVRVVMSE
jgi:hypothetical protein